MAKQPEFARPTTGVKMPDSGLFDDPSPAPEPIKKVEWKALPAPPPPGRYGGTSPYNHAPVLVTPDGERAVVAQWQTTRKMLRGVWTPIGFFAGRNTGGRPVGFEPVGWREYSE